jgi:hypothetical protein
MVKAPDAERRQEVLVIHNLSSIFENIESLQVFTVDISMKILLVTIMLAGGSNP